MFLDHFQVNLSQLLIDFYLKLVVSPCISSNQSQFIVFMLYLARQMKKRREGELIETFEGHQDGINCLAMASDESVLVSGSEDATARIWDLEDQPRFNPFGQIMQPVDPENPKCLGVLT